MNLDPNDFEVTVIAVVDEFKMTDDEGSLVAQLDAKYLQRLVARMNAREAETGDMAPIVIGHTKDGMAEVQQPQIVGYGRNWSVGPLFDTGRQAAFCQAWVYKVNKLTIDGEEVILTASEVAKRWPRRSAEVWTNRHEIDPISLLGATTPARDLGLMKLSRTGSLTYYSPGDSPVPTPQSPDIAGAAAGLSGSNETMTNLLQQILAGINGLKDALAPAPAPDAGAPVAGAPPGAAPAGAPGGDTELTDDELAQLLGGSGDQGAPGAGGDPDDQSRKGDKPVQNSGMGYPGGANTRVTDPQVRLSRMEEEVSALRNENARIKLSATLTKIRESGVDVDPNDEALISDLAAMPPEIRDRQVARLKLQRKAPVNPSFNLEDAINKSTDGTQKRMSTPEQTQAVIKLARDKKITFEVAAAESGYQV